MTSGTYNTSLPSAEYETSNCLRCVTPTSLSLFFKFLFSSSFAFYLFYFDMFSFTDFISCFPYSTFHPTFCLCLISLVSWDLFFGYVFFSLSSLPSFSVLISFLCLLLWILLYFRLSLTSRSISASLFDVSLYFLSLFLFLLSFLLFFLHMRCFVHLSSTFVFSFCVFSSICLSH